MTTNDEILQILSKDPDTTTTQIAERLQISPWAVRKIRKELNMRGRLGRPRGRNERVCICPGEEILTPLRKRAADTGMTLPQAVVDVLRKERELRLLVQTVARVCRGMPVSDQEWIEASTVLGDLLPAERP